MKPKPILELDDREQVLLSVGWLDQTLRYLGAQNLPEGQLPVLVQRWMRAVLGYARWLTYEGFSYEQTDSAVRKAIKLAQFDLAKFPVVA